MTSRGPASDSFEHDDAAYLLGALSGAERAAFEAHLPGCAACTARVAALRPVVGALTAARDEARDALLVSLASQDGNSAAPDAPTATARADDVTGLVRLVERRRRRARWAIGGVATVAAATIAALAIALASPAAPATTAEALQMTAVGIAPIRATAAIAAVPWGSKITIDCSYDGSSRYAQRGVYGLEVVDSSGHVHEIGSWALTQDATARFTSGTALPPDEIRAINVTAPGGDVVLRLAI